MSILVVDDEPNVAELFPQRSRRKTRQDTFEPARVIAARSSSICW
jgi:hypothetical protein